MEFVILLLILIVGVVIFFMEKEQLSNEKIYSKDEIIQLGWKKNISQK